MTFKSLLYTAIFVIGVLIVFTTLNLGLNLYERTFRVVNYEELKGYCYKKDLSENYAIVVDYSKPSGKHRFFVCDLKKKGLLQVVYAHMEQVKEVQYPILFLVMR